jgi:hypothetical protein
VRGTTQPNAEAAGRPTQFSIPLTARIEHAKNADPPTAHAEQPEQDATQASADATERTTQDATSPTDSIERVKSTNLPTAHMEHPVRDTTQPTANPDDPTLGSTPPTARAEGPMIALLKVPTLLMKQLPRELNDFLSFPTPPDPLDLLHHGLVALCLTLLHPFR